MVLGLFFCSILAAGMWYLAGLGDAILYRERASEAADAVAFTASAVHAKGMNIIVLLNLTMAAVLSIRVALKALLTVEIIAEVVFGLICLNPFGGEWACAALPLVGDAIGFTQDAIQVTREPINMALTSMSKTQEVVARVIPPAALAASTEVGTKYKPTVMLALGVSQPTLTSLPVEAGSANYLCKEAGEAIGDILAFILKKAGLGGIGAAAKWIGDRVGDLVKGNPAYWCEIPGTPKPPQGTDLMDAVKEQCKQKKQQADDSKTKFDQAKCEKDTLKENQDKINGKLGAAGGSSNNWDKMLPKKPASDYGNGCSANETVGVAEIAKKKIEGDRKMVALGHFSSKTGSVRLAVESSVGAIAGAVPDAFTQSEFFFDCKGQWTGRDCNRDGEDAMWHFRWRPRLVLFDNTHKLFRGPAMALASAFTVRYEADEAASVIPFRRNYKLLAELQGAAKNPKDVYIH